MTTIAKCNFDDISNKTKLDIKRWTITPFMSLIQRTESVRMNLLPIFLVLFQALPTEITKKQFLECSQCVATTVNIRNRVTTAPR